MGAHRPHLVIELDALIGQFGERAGKLRKARGLILEAIAPGSTKVAPARKSGRATVAAGSVADRVLTAIRARGAAGASRAQIAEVALARPLDVSLTLKELIADGRVNRAGGRKLARYHLTKGQS